MMLYRFVDQQKAAGFPVECICDVAGVSRAAYYHWKRHRDGFSTVAELDGGTTDTTAETQVLRRVQT